MVAEKYPIYHLSFKNQYLLASTFLRFSEHYESPGFRGKIFSWEKYMDWYAGCHDGKFTYFNDWTGFNIPSRALRPFYEGKFNPLTRKEAALLRLFKNVSGRFYVVGTFETEADTLVHECLHGLFDLFPDYKKEVLQCLKRFPTKPIRKCLMKMGYHLSSILDDEINAYLLTGLSEELEELRKRRKLKLEPIRRALDQVFVKHFGYSIRKSANWKRLISRLHKFRAPVT